MCSINGPVLAKVKWFNQFKGYGFVEVEEISEDVFLHFSVVDSSKISSLNNNDIILCEITHANNKYQVSNILEVTHHDKHAIEDEPPEEMDVIVKWFNPSKGFGFGKLSCGEDVFIHANLLKIRKIHTLEQGEKVRLLIRKTNYGYEAIDIVG